MTVTLGLNISSLRSQRQLARSSGELSDVFTRLSSGQRINKASDDAAGLAIADSLNADSRVYNQGVRNLNDGISVLNIADGALQELTNITFRLTELAEQAANGTLGTAQRASLDEEAQALKAEYFRIAKSTEFNGRKIFTGGNGELALQAGYGSDAILQLGVGGAIGTGAFGDSESVHSLVLAFRGDYKSADFNNDGHQDFVGASAAEGLHIGFGNGDGSFQPLQEVGSLATPFDVAIDDFNKDGNLDLIVVSNTDELALFYGNGDGTFQDAITSIVNLATASNVEVGYFNDDDILDVAISGSGVEVLVGKSDGTFESTHDFPGAADDRIVVGDFNNDGLTDIIGTSNLAIWLYGGHGDGTVQFPGPDTIVVDNYGDGFIQAADFNADGNLDFAVTNNVGNAISVFMGDGTGQFAITDYAVGNTPVHLQIGDVNGDGKLDLVSADYGSELQVLLGNGDGSFGSAITFAVSDGFVGSAVLADFTGDGVLDIFTAGQGLKLHRGEAVAGVAPLLDFSLETIAGARQALPVFQQKLEQLAKQRGEIGSHISRIVVAENVLKVSSENFKAAESRIRDADIAQESANLVRLQILQQAASSVLGQANQQPQLVLQLLGGNR